jgi:hypothetical protein
MTGQEFLDKVRQINTITDIHWCVEGDVLDPESVKVVIIADDEEIQVEFPRPGTDTFKQYAFIGLLINKYMEQIGNDFRTNAYEDLSAAIKYSIKHIQRI